MTDPSTRNPVEQIRRVNCSVRTPFGFFRQAFARISASEESNFTSIFAESLETRPRFALPFLSFKMDNVSGENVLRIWNLRTLAHRADQINVTVVDGQRIAAEALVLELEDLREKYMVRV